MDQNPIFSNNQTPQPQGQRPTPQRPMQPAVQQNFASRPISKPRPMVGGDIILQPSKKSSKKGLIISLILVLILAIAGISAAFLLKKNGNEDEKNAYMKYSYFIHSGNENENEDEDAMGYLYEIVKDETEYEKYKSKNQQIMNEALSKVKKIKNDELQKDIKDLEFLNSRFEIIVENMFLLEDERLLSYFENDETKATIIKSIAKAYEDNPEDKQLMGHMERYVELVSNYYESKKNCTSDDYAIGCSEVLNIEEAMDKERGYLDNYERKMIRQFYVYDEDIIRILSK